MEERRPRTRGDELAALGKSVGEAQGYDPDDASINWEGYGLALAENRAPNPEKFRTGPRLHVVPPPASKAPARYRSPGIRIGSYELSLLEEEELARNRPQRRNRPGERTTGRYRLMRHRSRFDRLEGRR